MTATGPSTRAVCRVINQNSCGSGSICGIQNGKSLILTNAHVAGTQIGRIVQVEVESLNRKRIDCRVIRAAYSQQVVADWALLETVEPFSEVDPVYLSKNPPSGSHYTKGFPRCQPHNGTDIETHRFFQNGVWLWLPDAIGGQSGSGVYSDDDNRQYGLLTWSWGDGGKSYGAGQPTNMIYTQNRSHQLMGFPKMPGLNELTDDFDFSGVERGSDDPIVQEGFWTDPIESGIQDYPIWAEDRPSDPIDPDDPDDPVPGNKEWKNHMVNFHREQLELHEAALNRLTGGLAHSGGLFPTA